MQKMPLTPLSKLTAAALVSAAAGIVIQILSGAEYPMVPPGLIILLVPAVLVWLAPWRWVPIVGALAALSQVIGLFAAGQSDRLFTFESLGDSVGLWIQLAATIVATVAGLAAAGGRDRDPVSRRKA